MKKIFLLSLIVYLFIFCNNFVFATEIEVQTNVLLNKDIKAKVNKIKTKRIIMANALLLDDSQRKKANEIYSKVVEKEAIQYAQLKKEQDILKTMTKENSTNVERRAQRKAVNSLYNAIKTSENETDKEFKKILNHSQRVKFNRLRKEIVISDF